MYSKIISVAQQKGGSGKTTIAAHLAVAFAKRGNKILLVDVDPQGSMTRWHELRAEKYGVGYTGINFKNMPGWKLSSEINFIRSSYDIIVIDCPPHVEIDTKSAIRQADLLLIPMQPNPTDLWATEKTIELAQQENVNFKVILNRFNENLKSQKEIVAKLDREHIAPHSFSNRIVFASSMMDGRTAIELERNSPAAQEIRNITYFLENILAIKEEEELVL